MSALLTVRGLRQKKQRHWLFRFCSAAAVGCQPSPPLPPPVHYPGKKKISCLVVAVGWLESLFRLLSFAFLLLDTGYGSRLRRLWHLTSHAPLRPRKSTRLQVAYVFFRRGFRPWNIPPWTDILTSFAFDINMQTVLIFSSRVVTYPVEKDGVSTAARVFFLFIFVFGWLCVCLALCDLVCLWLGYQMLLLYNAKGLVSAKAYALPPTICTSRLVRVFCWGV